jgi:hypothetical protein
MAIQLPPNSTGVVLDTRPENNKERQVVSIGDPVRTQPTRRPNSGRVLYVNDFRSLNSSMWNDGVGSASRDTDIWFAGNPTLRLDPQGQSAAGVTNPGRTANVSGVVVKQRIHDGFRQKYGVEAWFRMTSTNLTLNTFFSLSIYNRDGAQAYHGRVWLDPNGNNQPMVARILDGTATATASGGPGGTTAVYTPVVTSVSQNGAGSHMFYPASGRVDRAGGWHYVKMVVDFAALKYVSIQLDGEAVTDLSGYNMDVTTTTGFAGMHHSFELCASTTSRPRWVNIAHMVGTVED